MPVLQLLIRGGFILFAGQGPDKVLGICTNRGFMGQALLWLLWGGEDEVIEMRL